MANERVNVFWTGGYDSTFRVCHALLVEKRECVLPIYLTGRVDDARQSCAVRTNVQQELAAMAAVRARLKRIDPSTAKRLLPLRQIAAPKYTPAVTAAMKTLHADGKVRRPVCQYGAMAQYSLQTKMAIEVACEKSTNCVIYNGISGLTEGDLGERRIAPEHFNSHPALAIWEFLRWPTLQLSKDEMLQIARDHGFDDLLRVTVTCRRPGRTGEPCGRCTPCQDRVV